MFCAMRASRVQLADRKSLAICRSSLSDSGSGLDDLFDFYEDTWNLVGSFPLVSDEKGVVLPDRFIDPTVAVVADREKPLIAIADNLCSIGAFEWDGTSLSVLWRQEHSFEKHSSAAVSANGLMVFGRQDGKVQAYDVETGVTMWEYDAGQPVFATPESLQRSLFLWFPKTISRCSTSQTAPWCMTISLHSNCPCWG